ncbi:hypothetical protein SLS53_000705 [Cytospora paraplurivora]|uniref:Uncharacterized protein n=1 Tax=Cytospora paraplurivora TaxID=2898453 RepID=A0AAN9YKL5_9PEZI
MSTVLTRRQPPPAQERVVSDESGKDEPETTTTSLSDDLGLGVALEQKKFFWQRSKKYDPNAIATLPSVFDDPETAEKYHPSQEWENYHRFDPSARWTWGEEQKLVRKIDIRIMIFAVVMFMALEIDRSNLAQALSDNFLSDLGLETNGFIPDVILYLSYFYKHHELSIRLGYFWTGMSFADIISALMAYGLLHMRGVAGYAGWRWLFMIEGIVTFVVGISAYALMPAGPCHTASWLRGKNGWFNEREQTIIVNRVLREDPSKSGMHNRQPVTPKLLWQSLKDYDLWPLYFIGMVFQMPTTPQTQYLTLTLKGLGFGTFQVSLLSIPQYVGHIIMMLTLTYVGEIWGELTWTALLGQIWSFPLLVAMVALNLGTINKWVLYAILVLLLSYPNAHPIQAGGIIASNIYRADDKPLYKRGNKVLLGLCCMNLVLYPLLRVYYVSRNKSRDKKWNALTEEQRLEYLNTTTDQGNKRLDFRFQY